MKWRKNGMAAAADEKRKRLQQKDRFRKKKGRSTRGNHCEIFSYHISTAAIHDLDPLMEDFIIVMSTHSWR